MRLSLFGRVGPRYALGCEAMEVWSSRPRSMYDAFHLLAHPPHIRDEDKQFAVPTNDNSDAINRPCPPQRTDSRLGQALI